MTETRLYSYTGPQYYHGNKIATKSNLFTRAKSWRQARNNFLFNIANGDIIDRYDIVDDFIKEVPPSDVVKEPIIEIKTCEICGYQLNDMGDCPVCDYGEYDLLDLEG